MTARICVFERVLIQAIGEVPMNDTPTGVRGHSGARVPVSVEINRLFAAFHMRGCDEESNAAAAAAVSRILGRPVLDRDIAALRTTRPGQAADPEVLAALFEHFCLPVTQFTCHSRSHDRIIEHALHLMASVRDLGPDVYAL
ncbi:hypothetical protein [Nocardia jinanensis]|uniref:Uncharacterized protein n=1 Tax=Nocardia jinanensis TaxID=382504 RepID=A0A917VUX0_9NOCA|nr:hypothetical protein [Nocardia jinanensis]GGL20560.1 hypothetical protein GCM10011588_39200 [Nocardia jinanensis]